MDSSGRPQADPALEREALALFEALLDVPEEERQSWLTLRTAGRSDLASRIEAIRDAHRRAVLHTGAAIDAIDEPPPPERIGAYRIAGLIGRGGMGSVYRGERATGDFTHVVAIKLIKPGLLSEALVERFQRERQTLASLSHPNIARLYDGGETAEGSPYIVMEYVDGLPLLQWAEERDPPLEERLRLFADICAAVGFAHRNGIVHRDLTPANVLVTSDDQAKLIDFGIARAADAGGERKDGTQPIGTLSLTPGYAAPERLTSGEVTIASDVYSLGKLLEGLVPPDRHDKALRAIVSRATAHDPAARHPSAEALAAEVRSWGASAGGRPRTNRRAVLAGGMGALAAIGAGGWWWLRGDAPPAAPEAALRLRDEGLAASRLGTAEGTAQAVGHLLEAVRIAPGYAEGWGSLALAYESGQHFAPERGAEANRRRARAAAERALALDRDNASAHAALALAIPLFGEWLAAERAFRRVLALDPAQFEACSMLSRTMASVGRTREALAALDPIRDQIAMLPSMQYWLAFLSWCTGRIDEADRVIDRAMTLWPRSYQVWFTRFWLFVFTGRGERAIAMATDLRNRPPGIPDWNFDLIVQTARAVVTRGREAEDEALAENVRRAREGAGFAEIAIELAGAFGRADTAFEVADAYYFGRGFTVGTTRYTRQQGSYTPPDRRNTKFLFNPTTAAMRADQRFGALVRAIGLADYWRQSGSMADALRG